MPNMKNFDCIDCGLAILTEDMEAKLCKCDFKSDGVEMPDLSKPFQLAPELVEEIMRMAQVESNSFWARNSPDYQPEEYAIL